MSETITVVTDSAVGPYVEYAQSAESADVDGELPRGWSADYSSQIKADSGLYRAPLVRTPAGRLEDAVGALEARGWSKAHTASALGTTRRSMERYAAGTVEPSLTLVLLAEKLAE